MKINLTTIMLLSTLSILISVSTSASVYSQEGNTTEQVPEFLAIQHAQ